MNISSSISSLSCTLFLLLCLEPVHAQDSAKKLQEVIITESRTRNLDNVINIHKVPAPVTIIDKKTIAIMGSRRLDEVLREQTGMAIVSDLGSGNRSIGLQMQGFSSEYITILINGQPIAGRNSGNLDLSRISVSDIERIEVIKGASSSLFGSEALGGVVNIITRQQVTQTQALVSLQHGTYKTTDATIEAETPFAKKKGGAWLTANYYRTDGFNVNTKYLREGKTSPPYDNLSFMARTNYDFDKAGSLHFTARYANRHSIMDRSYGAMPTRDVLDEDDLNAMLAHNLKLGVNTRIISRYYFTTYKSSQEVTLRENGITLQNNDFKENIHRVEMQASHDFKPQKLSLIGGAGGAWMQNIAEAKGAGGNMTNYFAYTQASWQPVNALNIIAGFRLDGNSVYGQKVSPAAGISYALNSWLTAKMSVGRGFKSPTYKQLYQVFTNVTQGYTIVGANVFEQSIADLKAAGQVQAVWEIAGAITDLKPETSTSWNGGVIIKPVEKLKINFNGFYNTIYNQIVNQQVGLKKNGSQLFSWFNIAKAYTYGAEAGIHWNPMKGLVISGGYQLLYAKDQTVIDSIKNGGSKYRTVRAPNAVRPAGVSDYFGLPDRSRHMANLQIFYEYKPLGLALSVRMNYRSKAGFQDMDNNGYIDRYDAFVDGFALLNASVQKKILKERLTLQLTAENINDYTDYLMPAQPGRMILAGLVWRCFKQAQ
ncbi:outer membrane receptor for ferrienterochelin and colicins [Pseudobacter ginsenosidimutans]|uniref:Outer membrane receptor for ferrienterochelin and colicins n=1 Tax=Pseudobacter ginsenosidimutans TaxID=661488 RepID=A0A4Q7N3T5_9BACT|nr:outer membrane receptor for ferrienterochelin and colicins [Pseudobacter ginsenosidimutans]